MVGGVKPGKRGRGALGKTYVAVAVEQFRPRGFGRCRLAVIPNAQGTSLRQFLLDNVEPGSTVLTDAHSGYSAATMAGYTHVPYNIAGSGVKAHIVLPGVHRVASLAKRWLLGTHQGAVEADHLQAYLDEFAFRFNRRNSRARGMLFFRLLEQAVGAPPVTYRDLVVSGRPKRVHPSPPSARRVAPGTIAIPAASHPWRTP